MRKSAFVHFLYYALRLGQKAAETTRSISLVHGKDVLSVRKQKGLLKSGVKSVSWAYKIPSAPAGVLSW